MNLARISAAWLLAAATAGDAVASGRVAASAPPAIMRNGAIPTLTTAARSPLASVLAQAMAAYAAGDFDHARTYFWSLADQGSAITETMLGVMYARGQGVAPDPATAAAYWLRAANRGYAPGQLAFARALASGKGVTRDPGAAWVWASLAARGSDVAIAQEASGLAAQLRRGFTEEQAATLAKRLAGWRPWIAG